MVMLLPMPAMAEEAGGEGEALNIPEIVLEHLADSYEWHIASYQGVLSTESKSYGLVMYSMPTSSHFALRIGVQSCEMLASW